MVPVALDSGRLWPRGFVKQPGTIHFHVGEIIPPGLKRDEIEARVHAAINALELAPQRRAQLRRRGDDLRADIAAISASVKLFSPGCSVTSTARLSPCTPVVAVEQPRRR